ncbi:MAG: TolC family protein, partial [Acidobacteriota bacterium]
AAGAPARRGVGARGGGGAPWPPCAAAPRGRGGGPAGSQARALGHQLEELERAIEIEIRSALAELRTARAATRVRERGVELASETLRVERERNAAGRSTTNDLLDAEAALRSQTTLRDLSRLDVLRAWVLYDLATGSFEASSPRT